MLKAQEFVDQMQTPTTKLNIKQLREREDFWRALWSWIPDDVKYYVLRVGQTFRLVRRDYKGSVGIMGQVKFEVKEFELTVYEKTYNYLDGKYYYEDKVVKIPSGAIMFIEHITGSVAQEQLEKEELAPLPETDSLEKVKSDTPV